MYIYIIKNVSCKDESGCKKKDCSPFKFQILAGIGKHQKCGKKVVLG